MKWNNLLTDDAYYIEIGSVWLVLVLVVLLLLVFYYLYVRIVFRIRWDVLQYEIYQYYATQNCNNSIFGFHFIFNVAE